MAICVPLIILVISKTFRKSKYTISKTIIWSQSWICLEIQDLNLHHFEIISNIIDLQLQIFEDISKIIDLDIQIIDLEIPINDLDIQIYDF